MNKYLKTCCSISLAIILCGTAWAMNSLVSPDDIKKMKKGKISDALIQMLIAEQTCSVTADFLLKLKRFGADNKMLEGAILADRYKNPTKKSLPVKQLEILKKAGYSDEVILRLFNFPQVKRTVDERGNESVVYSTGGPSQPGAADSGRFHDIFNINIEKVERD